MHTITAKHPFRRSFLLAAAALLPLAACADEPLTVRGDSEHAHALHHAAATPASGTTTPDASQEEWLKAVRQATARFHSTTQALKAGYEPDPHCVAVPGLGGMGYHWVNSSLIDPVFDPQQPEALLYATGPSGQLQLVGVEYVVIDVGQPQPTFAGHPFDIGGIPPLMEAGVPHWSLHLWLYAENPSGLFMPFNPTISCP